MPTTTPSQKINSVEMHGREFVEIVLTGDTFDDSYNQAVFVQKKKEEHLSILLMMNWLWPVKERLLWKS